MNRVVTPPILDNKRVSSKSLFTPSALLREARRQKGLADVPAPSVCIFDPDGDLARRLRQMGRSKPFAAWPCYHTDLDTFELGGRRVGIVARVVGASFAVLVAEELFASGCGLLVSLTSAGQITPCGAPPYFVVIDRALRDEGASYHYAPPSEFADADPGLVKVAAAALAELAALRRRGQLDDGRSLSRDCRSDRRGARQRHPCGRDGSGGALHVRPRRRRSHPLPRPRHQYNGTCG